ncbi:SatD family protein [Fodinibacter luteus]|uniref:SatD family protein n=1 Tax=Fodinibacter luteus TaxID=552064 RepID=A0ABP8KG65_9MICO
MARVKNKASQCVLIGDVVGSRGSADRHALHRALEDGLAGVDAAVPAIAGLRVTVGDEFQASYASLGDALEAALRVRLALLPEVDTRIGVGRGPVTTLDAERGIEDGPGWWAARDAIEAAEEAADRPATRHLRTTYRVAPDAGGASAAGASSEDAINAALLCRDHLVGSMSERSIRLLRGLMEPHTTQGELAAREGISASAVSQRVRADGIGAVLAAQALLRGLA